MMRFKLLSSLFASLLVAAAPAANAGLVAAGVDPKEAKNHAKRSSGRTVAMDKRAAKKAKNRAKNKAAYRG